MEAGTLGLEGRDLTTAPTPPLFKPSSNRLPAKLPTPSNNNIHFTATSNNRQRNYSREWSSIGSCSNASHQQGMEHICTYCKLPDHTIASCPTRPTRPSSDWLVTLPPPPPASDQSDTLADAPLLSSHVPTSPLGQLSPSRTHSHAAVVRRILCSKSPLPNAFGARIPVPSIKLNLPLCNSPLENYFDRIVADFPVFGWPINYHAATFPKPSSSNHSSAVRFPDTIDAFLLTEIEHAATAGPFISCNPFPTPHLQTSPLQTVSKGAVTLGNFSCNLSRNFVATQVARNIA